MSPTQRSLKHLRELGWHVAVVEKWNPFAHIRQDAFGWVDLLCVHPKLGNLWVQTTTKANMNARILKAQGNPALVAFIISGGRLEVHGWRKLKGHWVVDSRNLLLQDLIAPQVDTPAGSIEP